MILDKYNNTFNEFITKYEEIHINPWHSIQKEKIMKKKNELLTTMDVTDVYSFTYFMKYLIKLLCGTKDTHTIFDMTSRLPINFKIIENEVLINYPTSLKGNALISINDIDIKTILNELDKVVSYGTLGKKQFELENKKYIDSLITNNIFNPSNINIEDKELNEFHKKLNKKERKVLTYLLKLSLSTESIESLFENKEALLKEIDMSSFSFEYNTLKLIKKFNKSLRK